MRHIVLRNLLLGLDDLFSKRVNALKSFEAGTASIKFLTARRDKIAALPPKLTGRPLAEDLETADGRHDGGGRAIFSMTEAYFQEPDTAPEVLEAAKKIRAAFIPSLDALQARYDAEAKAAKDNEPSLETLKNELMMFPIANGKTLYDWAMGFVGAGKKIDSLLSQRADTKDRKAASTLRGEALSKLNRLREDLIDAMNDDPSLPKDLEAQVFGYFDLLEARDAEAAAEEKKKQAAKKNAPPGAPQGSGAPTS